jgi:hypothetical protein
MSTAYSTTRELARPSAPVPTANGTLGSTSLADLLEAAGAAIDALPTGGLETRSAHLAALAAHLVDGANEAGGGLFVPTGGTAPILSLRALGRLAARTAGHEIVLRPGRASRIRTLIEAL